MGPVSARDTCVVSLSKALDGGRVVNVGGSLPPDQAEQYFPEVSGARRVWMGEGEAQGEACRRTRPSSSRAVWCVVYGVWWGAEAGGGGQGARHILARPFHPYTNLLNRPLHTYPPTHPTPFHPMFHPYTRSGASCAWSPWALASSSHPTAPAAPTPSSPTGCTSI